MPDTKQPAILRYFDADAVSRIAAVGVQPLMRVEGSLVGKHRSPFHGFAIEFAGHRQYVQGDDIRHLDWKVFFKSDRLMIKQYEEDTNFIGHILVDVSESMKFEHRNQRKIDYAAFMAVAIANAVVRQSDMVSATFFDDRIRESIPATGSEEILGKISHYLEKAELKGPTSMSKVLGQMSEQVGRRKCVFVISDFFTDLTTLFDGVKRLLFRNCEVIFLHVLDPLELDFDLSGQVELIELEGEGRLQIEGQSMRESYNKGFAEYLTDLRTRCRGLGLDYVLCDTSRNFGLTLAEYLNNRVARGAG